MDNARLGLPVSVPRNVMQLIKRHGLEQSFTKAYEIFRMAYGDDITPEIMIDPAVEGDRRNERVVFFVGVPGTFDQIYARFREYYRLLDDAVPENHNRRIGVVNYPAIAK